MKRPERIKIVLADDHVLVREGLKTILSRHQDIEVVGEVGDGRVALDMDRELQPHILLLDISMPGLNAAATTRELNKTCPKTQIIALTVHEDKGYVRELVEAGVAAYVLKRSGADDLITAIREVAVGGKYLDPNLASKLVGSLVGRDISPPGQNSHLSEREAEVLKLIAQGYTNKEIATQLSISIKSVETYKTRAMEKLNLRSRTDIIRHALHKGWLENL